MHLRKSGSADFVNKNQSLETKIPWSVDGRHATAGSTIFLHGRADTDLDSMIGFKLRHCLELSMIFLLWHTSILMYMYEPRVLLLYLYMILWARTHSISSLERSRYIFYCLQIRESVHPVSAVKRMAISV
jgi:hypothetical protein